MSNPVRVFKRKYDGRLTREVEGDLIEASDSGWLVVHNDAELHRSWKRGAPAVQWPHLLMFASTFEPLTWWLFYDALGELDHAHADAALPATIASREISYVDLDLDLIVAADLTYYVRDEAEFAVHRESMGYPGEVVSAALRGMLLAKQAVDGRRYPFDGSAALLLGRVLASRGPL